MRHNIVSHLNSYFLFLQKPINNRNQLIRQIINFIQISNRVLYFVLILIKQS